MSRAPSDLPFLVAHSGGRFQLTIAGRDVIKSHPARFEVLPGSVLSARVISEAERGVGRVPKKLIKLHDRVTASGRAAGVARMAMQLRQQMPEGGWGAAVQDMLGKKKRAELLEHAGLIGGALLCTVDGCGAEVGPGGRKTSPAKCARCYQRARRGLPEAPRGSAELRDQKLTVSFTARGRELLEKRAAGFGVSISVLLEGLLDGTYVAHRVKR